MLPKFAYGIIFLFLTTLHICPHLIPVVEANAHLRTVDSHLIRRLFMNVGYEYNHTMLLQSLINSTLIVYGIWRCQREAAQKQLDQQMVQRQETSDAQSGTVRNISPAAEVKLNWLQQKGKLPSSWKLFPLRSFWWYTLPWLFTFIGNGLLNFRHLNLVMGHFCTSPLEVMSLYSRIQFLYLRNIFSDGFSVFLGPFNGALGALLNKHTNFINYESNLLNVEEEMN